MITNWSGTSFGNIWLKKEHTSTFCCLQWATILLGHNFKIKYLLSKEMGHADSFSRLLPNFKEPFEDKMIASIKAKEIIYAFGTQ